MILVAKIPFKERILPSYSGGEEIFNWVSHAAGGALGIAALVLLIVKAAIKSDVWSVVAASIYGATLVILYTMSTLYHALKAPTAKRVMQVMDHCTINLLIAGTYTPIALCAIRRTYPGWGWSIFGVVWGFCILACVFTAIDLNRFSKLAMICYIGMGWCIVIAAKQAIATIPLSGLLYLLAGGIAYTVGAVLYKVGKRKKWIHSVFHLFVILGSVLHFFCIYIYVI